MYWLVIPSFAIALAVAGGLYRFSKDAYATPLCQAKADADGLRFSRYRRAGGYRSHLDLSAGECVLRTTYGKEVEVPLASIEPEPWAVAGWGLRFMPIAAAVGAVLSFGSLAVARRIGLRFKLGKSRAGSNDTRP